MLKPRTASTAIGYLVLPYILISTFQFQIAKDGLQYSSVFVLMGLRYLLASSFIFGVTRKFKPILNKDTILLSLFTFGSSCFWGFGLLYVSPAESAVLSYTMPLLSIPVSILILSEKASIKEWGGAVVGFVGVLVYSIPLSAHALTLLGAVLTIMNAFFWAMYTVFYRKLKGQDQPMTVATQFLIAALLFSFFAPLEYKWVAGPRLWFDLAYLSILSGVVSFFLWNTMLRLRRVGKTTTLIYLIPAAATLVESLETSVMPASMSLIGIFLMTLGVCLATFERIG